MARQREENMPVESVRAAGWAKRRLDVFMMEKGLHNVDIKKCSIKSLACEY